MARRSPSPNDPLGPETASRDVPESGSDLRSSEILEDAALVKRCIAGEVAAWEEVYNLCHPPLLVAIQILLQPARGDRSLVDEIAARVWYALVKNDGEVLEGFDPDRGARLITFMRTIAKDEISRYLRTEDRRRSREAARSRDRLPRSPVEQEVDLSEFLSTLTPHERKFADEYLLSEPSELCVDPPQAHSAANIWQLTRRIRKKLLSYLGKDA